MLLTSILLFYQKREKEKKKKDLNTSLFFGVGLGLAHGSNGLDPCLAL